MAGQRKLISLCMIVKDEEKHLPNCLTSVRGVVDEIIVVDTGSMDRTIEIAQSFGATVIKAEWEQHFSKARNIGLDQARGEWILFLDADESLDAAGGGQLRVWAQDEELMALLLQVRNVIGDEESSGSTVHPVLRMFRNAEKHRFEGRIHEQIAAAILRGNPEAKFQMTDVVIHHYGYRAQDVLEKNKLERNMKLLQFALAEEPSNTFHHYNIGVEFLRRGEADKALDAFRRARGSQEFAHLNYAHLVIKYEVRSLHALEKWAEAAEVAADGTSRYPDYTDMWHYWALSLAQLGRLREAAQTAEHALELAGAPAHYHTEEGIGTYRTAYLLGRISEALLDEQGLVSAYVAALRQQPSLLPPLFRLCRYFRAAGEEERLLAVLAARIGCPNEGAVRKLAAVMLASGCPVAAADWLRWQADLQEQPEHRRLLREQAEAIERQDYSGFPLPDELAQQLVRDAEWSIGDGSGERERGNRAVTARQWWLRADQWLAKHQQLRQAGQDGRASLRKEAVQLARLLLPGEEGW